MKGEIKHYIDENNIYKIELDGKVVLTIALDKEYNAIVVEKLTEPQEVFEGNPRYISLTSDVLLHNK